MDGKNSYRDPERLMELGRRLHSQAFFESLVRLVARTRTLARALQRENAR